MWHVSYRRAVCDSGPCASAQCIDYVGIHVWPDDWNFEGTDFQKKARSITSQFSRVPEMAVNASQI